MNAWPPCPVCGENELACLDPHTDAIGYKHALNCELYCYRCGKVRGPADKLNRQAMDAGWKPARGPNSAE